ARCRGQLADAPTIDQHFDEARHWHDRSPAPFERARTDLAYGECLRRARRRGDARNAIRCALETFEELGARHWAARAQIELAATGETARRRGDASARLHLTPHALRVALAVAAGSSDRYSATLVFIRTA